MSDEWSDKSREKLFLEKMTILNRSFSSFVQRSLQTTPDADLSPTVRDYLKHVDELDQAYGQANFRSPNVLRGTNPTENQNGKKSTSDSPFGAKSSSQPPADNAKSDSIKSKNVTFDLQPETKIIDSDCPPSASLGKFSFDAKKLTTKSILSFGSSESAEPKESNSDKRGTKRAKRGIRDGPDDEVIIKNYNDSTSRSTIPKLDGSFKFPSSKSSNDAWTNDKSSVDSLPTTMLMPVNTLSTSVGSTGSSQTNVRAETSFDLKSSSQTDSTSKLSSPLNTIPLFSFGAKSQLGKSLSDEKTFGLDFKSQMTKNDCFSSNQASDSLFPSSLNFKVNKEEPSKLVFSFNKLPDTTSGKESYNNSNASGSAEDESKTNEAEYVPPKPDIVLREEPNSIFSSKCSLFVLKNKEYEKLGIAQLHVKKTESDKKKVLLVRAATTIGTVWLNSFIDGNMKCSKVGDLKLRVSCLVSGSPSTFVIRLPDASICEKLEQHLNDKDA